MADYALQSTAQIRQKAGDWIPAEATYLMERDGPAAHDVAREFADAFKDSARPDLVLY